MDERSEVYFSLLRENRANIPSSYSSVDLGNVSPVKNQVVAPVFPAVSSEELKYFP